MRRRGREVVGERVDEQHDRLEVARRCRRDGALRKGSLGEGRDAAPRVHAGGAERQAGRPGRPHQRRSPAWGPGGQPCPARQPAQRVVRAWAEAVVDRSGAGPRPCRWPCRCRWGSRMRSPCRRGRGRGSRAPPVDDHRRDERPVAPSPGARGRGRGSSPSRRGSRGRTGTSRRRLRRCRRGTCRRRCTGGPPARSRRRRARRRRPACGGSGRRRRSPQVVGDRPGSTRTPGFSRWVGSKTCLTAAEQVSALSGEYILRQQLAAGAAVAVLPGQRAAAGRRGRPRRSRNARNRAVPSGRSRGKSSRTCRQPSPKWPNGKPARPWLSRTSLSNSREVRAELFRRHGGVLPPGVRRAVGGAAAGQPGAVGADPPQRCRLRRVGDGARVQARRRPRRACARPSCTSAASSPASSTKSQAPPARKLRHRGGAATAAYDVDDAGRPAPRRPWAGGRGPPAPRRPPRRCRGNRAPPAPGPGRPAPACTVASVTTPSVPSVPTRNRVTSKPARGAGARGRSRRPGARSGRTRCGWWPARSRRRSPQLAAGSRGVAVTGRALRRTPV